jgi:hypothetical protein
VLQALLARGTLVLFGVFDSYIELSELHYMHGAGPKWREKHALSAEFASYGAEVM